MNTKDTQNKELLVKELKEKLDWYTLHASEEEYDEQAVKSIMYLLDIWEPIDESAIPKTDEAWERFKEYAKEKEERSEGAEQAAAQAGKGAFEKEKFVTFLSHHKYIAVAAIALPILLVVLAVGGSMQAAADSEQGFFHWLKWDKTGTQMITSPENLDEETEVKGTVIYDKEDVPEWAQEWLEIEASMEIPENYEWQYYDVNGIKSLQSISSSYIDKHEKREIFIGIVQYFDKISYNREVYGDYSYVRSYKVEDNQMDIYSKIDEFANVFYLICFYDDNIEYFMRCEDDLEELQNLAERYWDCVKNNL